MRAKNLISTAFVIGALLAGPAVAGGVTAHVSQAGNHSVQASAESAQGVGHSVVSGAKLASGVVAVPLLAVERVGAASGAVGEVLWDAAAESQAALPISEEAVTAGPLPNEALAERF